MSIHDIEQYRKHMIAAANKILHDRDAAEDIAQEAMIAAIKTMKKEPIGNLKSWLGATASNMARAVLRAMKTRDAHKANVAKPESQLPSGSVESIKAVLDVLDPFHKNVIVWRYFHGESDAFISGMCGVSRSRARGLIMEAREAFRAKWIEVHGE